MTWIYDIETFSNYFSVIFKNPKTKELKEFIIFEEINDLDSLCVFINDHKKWFIGYNSMFFDNQILNFLSKRQSALTFLSTNEITQDIFTLTKEIIENDLVDFKYNLPFKSIDLMKVGGYQKGLKLLGVSLKWHKLQDLPIPVDSKIERSQVNTIRKYNLNDVEITEKLYEHLKDAIAFRYNISKTYNVNVYTDSDTGIANRLLEKFYSEASGLSIKSFKDLRTPRKFIKFDWVVFDTIKFHTHTLNKLLEEVRSHIYYEGMPFFKKKVNFDGITYKLGVGGIHSEDSGEIFEETEDRYIIDADIGSMYPATVINHQLAPEHLGPKFLKKFKEMRDERIQRKKQGDKTRAEGLKLIMNATIGKTLSKYSFLYDPIVNLRVTVNGQLYLLMLIEKLVLNNFKVISANTDGITTLVPKDREKVYYEICKKWEEDTRYELEYNYYTKYIRRDVNNYIAMYKGGDVKTKGIFINKPAAKFNNSTDPLNKGWDKPIVSIALYEFFVNNTPIEDTIKNHKNIYDFCIAKKIDKKFTNEFHYIKDGNLIKDQLQQSVRYYVSNGGGVLVKVSTDKVNGSKSYFRYEVNKNTTLFNDFIEHKDFKKYDIDYGYYINQTQKIINEIINQQLSLF